MFNYTGVSSHVVPTYKEAIFGQEKECLFFPPLPQSLDKCQISHLPVTTPSSRTIEPINTGASVLGVRYKDGIALASDTLVSYGSLARFRSVHRIQRVGDFSLLGASGEYSDFQEVLQILDRLIVADKCNDDGSLLYPQEIFSYLSRVMYQRRSKGDPFWNQFVLAGYRDGKTFLGLVDLHGTNYQDDTLATGYGAYIARPLLRKGWKADLTRDEAVKLLEESLRVLFLRDARALNRIEIATIDAEGVRISEPYELLNTVWNYQAKIE